MAEDGRSVEQQTEDYTKQRIIDMQKSAGMWNYNPGGARSGSNRASSGANDGQGYSGNSSSYTPPADYYATRPQQRSDVIVGGNGQIMYVDHNGNWVSTGTTDLATAAYQIAPVLGMPVDSIGEMIRQAQADTARAQKDLNSSQYGQVLSSAGNGQFIVQLGDGTKQVMAAADAAKVPGIYQADLDQAENDRMYRQYRGNEASFQAAGWDPRHLATLQGDNGTVPSSGANVFGSVPNVQQQSAMPQYGQQQQQAGMPQQQGMTPSWMQRPASAQTGQQPPPSGQTGYPPSATQTAQTGYAPPSSYGYGTQTGVSPGATSYTQQGGQTGVAPGGSSYSPYSAGSSLTQSPSTPAQSPSSSSPTQASMGQPVATGSTGFGGGIPQGGNAASGPAGGGTSDLSSFKTPDGMTNQQAGDLETQLKQWQTFANVPRYQRITAGPNGSYSGEDFLGNHQTLSKDQALQTGSATDAELYKAQSDYADQQKQLGLQIRSQQSRNMSGYDPNQVNSSIAGMH